MQEDDLYKLLINTVTTTVHPRKRNEELELDDQAPLALVICIALPLFIGFVILVLIYCCCRRRTPHNPATSQSAAGNAAAYHRAPENDGMGGMDGGGGVGNVGGSYPMTVVPNPYQTGYPAVSAGHMVPSPPSSQSYRIGPTVLAPSPMPSYPNQQVPVPPPPHFGGVPASYPPPPPSHPSHQYPHPIYLPPPNHPHTHSLSHSSQASSNSVTAADPLVPSSPPQHHHHHHHHHLLQQQQQQQQHQYLHQQQLFQQHQIQMQQNIPGRDSPAVMYQYNTQPASSSSYPLVQSSNPASITTTAQPNPDMFTSVTSSVDGTESTKMVTSPSDSHSPSLLPQPQIPEQDLGYSDEEE